MWKTWTTFDCFSCCPVVMNSYKADYLKVSDSFQRFPHIVGKVPKKAMEKRVESVLKS